MDNGIIEIVIYNACNCEIMREKITKERPFNVVMNELSMFLYPGDRIELI